MHTGRLNTTRIRKLKPKQISYMLADGNGLYLEVHPSGTKAWRLRYKRNGKPAKTNIGRWPAVSLDEARAKLAMTRPTLFSGVVGTSVKAFWERYQHEIVKRSRKNPEEIERYFNVDIDPEIGKKAVDAVTVDDLRRLIFAKREDGHAQAALALRDLLKRMYDYAVVCGVVAANPVLSIPRKFIAKASRRRRMLSKQEVGEFVCTVENSSLKPHLKAALMLLFLTMTRKMELLLARWEHIDLHKREWTIPPEHTKNKETHVVSLSSQAVRLLEGLMQRRQVGLDDGKRLVIPARWSTTHPISESTLNRALARIAGGMDHFTVHDLRRTASTLLNDDEYSGDVIEKALNHTTKGVRGVYDRAPYKEQRKKMLQDWADKVDDLAIEYRNSNGRQE